MSKPQGNEGPRGGGLPLPKSKFGIKGFYHDVIREMKKVNWPEKSETNRLTGVVLAVCAAVVIALAVMSVAFDILVKLITRGSV